MQIYCRTHQIVNYSEESKRDLTNVMNIIAERLDYYRLQIALYGNGPFHQDVVMEGRKYISWVEMSYEMLKEFYSKIIIRVDVIERKEKLGYLEYISKSQYYRYKYVAYDEFKHILQLQA